MRRDASQTKAALRAVDRQTGMYAEGEPTPGVARLIPGQASGKIAYDVEGMDEDELRKQIAKLGPEYAPLLPKPKQTPCVASK